MVNNRMIRMSFEDNTTWLPCRNGFEKRMTEFAKQSPIPCTMTVFKAGEVPLEKLPEEVQQEVLETLQFFAECDVTYRNGEFEAVAGCAIRASYEDDYFAVGCYKAN